jgi:hypothetical protein
MNVEPTAYIPTPEGGNSMTRQTAASPEPARREGAGHFRPRS